MNSKAEQNFLALVLLSRSHLQKVRLVCIGSHGWEVEIYILQEGGGQLGEGLVVILDLSFLT